MKRIDWTLLAIIIGCSAFLLVIGFQASALPTVRAGGPSAIRHQSTKHTNVREQIRLAARLGVQNRTIAALRILDAMNTSSMSVSEQNLRRLTKARLLVQLHDLDGAIKEYDAIPKDSRLWIDAIEEKGEVTARQGKYAEALGVLQTALAPQFEDRVHPLTFFVASLTHLKICDFAGVFTVSQEFKRNMKLRMPEWRARAATGDLAAKRNIAEAKTTLHDLEIIEADVIQRMSLAEKAADGRALGHIAHSEDVLRFPVSNSPNPEVWSDELGHYAARVKTCPAPHLFAQNQARRGAKQ